MLKIGRFRLISERCQCQCPASQGQHQVQSPPTILPRSHARIRVACNSRQNVIASKNNNTRMEFYVCPFTLVSCTFVVGRHRGVIAEYSPRFRSSHGGWSTKRHNTQPPPPVSWCNFRSMESPQRSTAPRASSGHLGILRESWPSWVDWVPGQHPSTGQRYRCVEGLEDFPMLPRAWEVSMPGGDI